jgi:hypothetical protein
VARLFVVFDPDEFGPSTEAICYVWAANEPVGAIYPNPYFNRVGTIVVESGSHHVGEWVAEERDFIADYWMAFGKPPETVAAVAIMVDTDNTDSKATAWFDDISIVLGESASTSPRPALEQGGPALYAPNSDTVPSPRLIRIVEWQYVGVAQLGGDADFLQEARGAG